MNEPPLQCAMDTLWRAQWRASALMMRAGTPQTPSAHSGVLTTPFSPPMTSHSSQSKPTVCVSTYSLS